MENSKSKLQKNSVKRQKFEANTEPSTILSDKLINLETMDSDKLERERKHLTDLNMFFPELVWKAVFKRIDGKDDIEHISNSCPYFRNLLTNQMEKEIVLPNVFAILANHFELDKFFKDINLGVACRPHIFGNQGTFSLPLNDIMNCRLVCKSWNNAFKEIHQNKDAGHYVMSRDFKSSKHFFPCFLMSFGDNSHIQKFIKHFEATHFNLVDARSTRCPLLWRYVRMEGCTSEEDAEAQFTAMIELITKWGEEVWYFEFEARCFEDYLECVEPYQKINKLCKLMPHLRVLSIVFDQEDHFEFESQDELENLIQEISINPFPKLVKLEYLCTAGVPVPFFGHLLDKHKQITQLNVERQELLENFTILSNGLPNLTQLSLEICSKEQFEMFERCDFHLKLRKMHFIYHDNEDYDNYSRKDIENSCQFISWLRVLTALENKIDTPSCTELYLKLPTPNTDAERKSALQDSLHYRLKCSNVQLITIWQATVFSLDFLLPLKHSLCGIRLIRGKNYLKDSFSFRENRVRENHFRDMQVIKFIGLEPNMQDSNISSILPRLKTVVVSLQENNVRYFYEHDGVNIKLHSPWPDFRGDLEKDYVY